MSWRIHVRAFVYACACVCRVRRVQTETVRRMNSYNRRLKFKVSMAHIDCAIRHVDARDT